MNKNLPLFALFFALIIFYLFFTKQKTDSVYLSPYNKISNIKNLKNENKVLQTVQKINESNKKIASFYCGKMPIVLKQKFLNFNCTGELAFEKPKNFRLRVKSLFGNEIDVGSNDFIFWFWGKRMNPSALHYADHERLNESMLRSALNPNWIMECLNLSEIKTYGVNFKKFENFYAIVEKRISNNNENMTVVILIDPVNIRINGRYLYDENEKMLASAEYIYKENLDAINFNWYEENIFLEWFVGKAKKNETLPNFFWEMPRFKNAINLTN